VDALACDVLLARIVQLLSADVRVAPAWLARRVPAHVLLFSRADIPLQLSAETERLHPRLESIGVSVPRQMPQQLARLIAGLPVGVRDGLADR
jgi:hypothetical protein